MTRKRLGVAVVLAAAALSLPTPAFAHGDLQDSSPVAGTRVTKPPKKVVLTLSEPAAEGSTVAVTDGCGDEVSGALDIRREVLETAITGGRPGRWRVDLRSVSAADGHATRETFTFKVTGRKDCRGAAGDDTQISPGTSSRPPILNPDEEETSFPLVAVALGAVAVAAVLLAIRRPWDKS